MIGNPISFVSLPPCVYANTSSFMSSSRTLLLTSKTKLPSRPIDFHYRSNDLDVNLQIKVLYLDTLTSSDQDFYITAKLYAHDLPIALPLTTDFGHSQSSNNYEWNTMLTFPIKIRDLPLTTRIALTIWSVSDQTKVPVGGTTLNLFNHHLMIGRGRQKLHLWKDRMADGSTRSKTPAKLYQGTKLDHIEKLIDQYASGYLDHIDWLDRYASQAIERINMEASQSSLLTEEMVLYIEQADFGYPVLFGKNPTLISSSTLPLPPLPSQQSLQLLGSSISDDHINDYNNHKNHCDRHNDYGGDGIIDFDKNWLMEAACAIQSICALDHISIIDWANTTLDHQIIYRTWTHPSEQRWILQTQSRWKNRRQSGPLDNFSYPSWLVSNLRPNCEDGEQLSKILNYTPNRPLIPSEMELIWRYRYYLQSNRKALVKFVKCIQWGNEDMVNEANEMIQNWGIISIEDVLQLLDKKIIQSPILQFVVICLEQVSSQVLNIYLPQLVQALRYESLLNDPSTSRYQGKPNKFGALTNFLVLRAIENPVLGNDLFWHLVVEGDSKNPPTLDVDYYAQILDFYLEMLQQHPKSMQQHHFYMKQKEFIDICAQVCKYLHQSKLSLKKKTEKLRPMLDRGGKFEALLQFEPLPLPLQPESYFMGIKPDVHIFNSTLMPLKLNLSMVDGSPYSTIFKMGDDLRQDQLIIQLISLMDGILKNHNLDLKLTPYRVLAASTSIGMIEVIPNSKNLAEVLEEFGDIAKYLRYYHPIKKRANRELLNQGSITMSTINDEPAKSSKSSPSNSLETPSSSSTTSARSNQGGTEELDTYGIEPSVLDNFVRSCAGYCVITYILGIGDRHLDNLLITRDGHLFHIDFGFILGRDPKPFPPPMKLCKEMVFGMGGKDSPHYELFTFFASEAYNILRKSSNLILSVVSIMTDANLQDLSQGDRALIKIMDKLKLELPDEEARWHVQNLISESVKAIVAPLMEVVHSWAKYWRS